MKVSWNNCFVNNCLHARFSTLFGYPVKLHWICENWIRGWMFIFRQNANNLNNIHFYFPNINRVNCIMYEVLHLILLKLCVNFCCKFCVIHTEPVKYFVWDMKPEKRFMNPAHIRLSRNSFAVGSIGQFTKHNKV